MLGTEVNGANFLVFNGVTYTAPSNGSYRIGVFNERDTRLGGEIGSDVNRDGNPTGSSGLFAVLWNTQRSIRCGSTRTRTPSFADEAPR